MINLAPPIYIVTLPVRLRLAINNAVHLDTVASLVFCGVAIYIRDINNIGYTGGCRRNVGQAHAHTNGENFVLPVVLPSETKLFYGVENMINNPLRLFQGAVM